MWAESEFIIGSVSGRTMNENYRHKRLLALLHRQKMLSTQDIIEQLKVSPATVRRDINKLNELGLLKKVRNGAEYVNNSTINTEIRTLAYSEEKERIAKAAADMCKDDQSVLITCGSTMMLLGQQLCGRKIQILTNYVSLANYLIEQKHKDLGIMGGQYNAEKDITISFSPDYNYYYAANIMFTSGRGFTEEGLFKTDMIIANSEKQMAAKSDRYVVLLDSSKLGNKVGMLFTRIDEIDTLITGQEADPQIIQKLRDKGLKIILA